MYLYRSSELHERSNAKESDIVFTTNILDLIVQDTVQAYVVLAFGAEVIAASAGRLAVQGA